MLSMANMAKQMELFDEGGLMQEGGTVDPVSGNDVPIGSTQEEVRDDIPAQLSEGEFVMPADVVRYHGLDKMMALRDEAKRGLARMDAMGQMGNSEEATIPDGVPFSIDDLEMEDDGQDDLNFNLGGVVPMPGTGVITTPNPAPTTGFKPYVPPVIPSFTGPQLQGTQFTTATQSTNLPTFGQVVGTNPGQYDELRRYVNDAGIVRRIPFKNGQPIYPIPEGFRFEPEDTTQVTDPTTTPTTTIGQQDDGGGDGDSLGIGTTGVGTSTVTGASDMETAMMDASRGMFGKRDSSAGFYGGSREFGLTNPEMRSATFDMAMAQLGSLSPMTAAGITIGNQLGILDNMATPNQAAIAGQTAKGMALAAMGFSNPGQIATNEQATAYGLAITAAMEAAKKGQDVRSAVDEVMAQNQTAVNQGILSAMTDLGYSRADVTNVEALRSAARGYNNLADSYAQDAKDAIASGTVRDTSGKAVTSTDPTTGKTQAVTTERARQQANAAKAKEQQARNRARTLGNEASQQDGGAPPGATPSSPADYGAMSPEDVAAMFDDTSEGQGDNQGGGMDGSEGFGSGDDAAAPICLTEDMKVKRNGVIDFVTKVQVGDIVDNTVVTEVLHKHMREGYYKVNGELKITNDHPVLANGSWKRTEDLVLGDYINNVEVTSLEYVEQVTPTVYIGTADDRYNVYTEGEVYTVHGQYKNALKKAA
tara:strand:+ start:355 stop:2469 length:2115 start_codon:yes stop_codon:yes gene_type:complete